MLFKKRDEYIAYIVLHLGKFTVCINFLSLAYLINGTYKNRDKNTDLIFL